MNIINLTPHQINIYDEGGNEVRVIEPSGTIAKIGTKREKIGDLLGIPIFKTKVSEPSDLPPERGDTIYIVSGMFLAHVGRADLYQPGELLRNEDGNPVGCIGLSQ